MDGITHYRTTDLELYSADDPTALAAALQARGLFLTHPPRLLTVSTEWFCMLQAGGEGYDEPDPDLAAMLTVIEALDPPLRSAWAACSLRVFDIGYDCCKEPFAFRQELSAGTLARLAAVGASLRVTLYSARE